MTKRSMIGLAVAVICLTVGLVYYLFSGPLQEVSETTQHVPTEATVEFVPVDTRKEVSQEGQDTGATVEVGTDPDNGSSNQAISRGPLAAAERESYHGSYDLPDGISFVHTVLFIEALKAGNDESEYTWLEGEMDIGREDAEELVDAVIDAKAKADVAIERKSYELLCNGEVQRVYGEDLYPVLEEIEDLGETVPEQYLNELYEQLDEPMADKLAQLVHERKLNVSYAKHDQKAAFEILTLSVDEYAAGICIDSSKKY